MLQNILTGITAYISTSIDYLVVLMVIFARVPKNGRFLVYVGDIVGTTVLVSVSLIVALVLKTIPSSWMLGWLGLIPIAMGIKLMIAGENDDSELVSEHIQKKRGIIFNVALITIATCGADNLGIYVPIFAQLHWADIVEVLITFAVMLTLFAWLGYKLVHLPVVAKFFEKWGMPVTIFVYIVLGVYIMMESGTITHVIG